ncbi:MAG: LysM peptidoglycan-binding domain-containing protein [Thermodesulfobacteriota bacterium]
MNDEFNNEIKDFDEDVRETLGYREEEQVLHRSRTSIDFKSLGTVLLFGAAAIILVAILMMLFTKNGESHLSREVLTALQDRQDVLEEKLIRLEQEVVKTKREAERGSSLGEIERTVKFLAIRVEKLAGKLDMGTREPLSSPAETESLLSVHRKPLSYGKNTYHTVRPGDTLYTIAKLYGTSIDELCRLNDIPTSQVIHPGESLLIAPAAE